MKYFRFRNVKVKVVAERGKSDNGYVALDGIFLDTVQCSVFPEDASPSHSTPLPVRSQNQLDVVRSS